MVCQDSASSRNGKARDSADGGFSSSEKVCPRSKEPAPVEGDATGLIGRYRTPQLYKGKCGNVKSGRKRGLLFWHVHYANHHKNLAEGLIQDQKEILESSKSSLAEATLDDTDDADQVGDMKEEMIYYFPIKLDRVTREQ
jgi:hypothetical protein